MEIRNPAVVSERSDDEQFITCCNQCAVTAAPFNLLEAPTCRRLNSTKKFVPFEFPLLGFQRGLFRFLHLLHSTLSYSLIALDHEVKNSE